MLIMKEELQVIIKHWNKVYVNQLIFLVDNDAYGTVALILTILFVSVANVLLLNVLVALFK